MPVAKRGVSFCWVEGEEQESGSGWLVGTCLVSIDDRPGVLYFILPTETWLFSEIF